MARMTRLIRPTGWTGLIACALALATLGGCAGPTAGASGGSVKVRCVDSTEPPDARDPRIAGTRPMFFLFCVQN
jgi:hypothetical protein